MVDYVLQRAQIVKELVDLYMLRHDAHHLGHIRRYDELQ